MLLICTAVLSLGLVLRVFGSMPFWRTTGTGLCSSAMGLQAVGGQAALRCQFERLQPGERHAVKGRDTLAVAADSGDKRTLDVELDGRGASHRVPG